jgi:glucose-1-phosphate cytidylyltransferase
LKAAGGPSGIIRGRAEVARAGEPAVKTLILCGGKGTRAYPQSLEMPKPLMPVGDSPVLLHLMRIFARQGFTDFVLAGGYRTEMLEEFTKSLPGDWSAQVIDTGPETGTAGRIVGCAAALGPGGLGSSFMATYGDGLGSIDLSALVESHRSHKGAMTVTAVPLPSPYGTLEWDETGRVTRFTEKPRLSDHWINAGFFVIDTRSLASWGGDDLERDVMPALADSGELYAHRHLGFWRSMDTYKDALELSALCREGEGPWTTLPASESSSQVPPGSSDPISAVASSTAGRKSTH